MTNLRPRLISLFLAIAAMALAVPSLASAASVTPTQVSGNPGCSDINPSWTEFKIDRLPANGTYSAGGFSVTISNVQNGKTFDWSDASQGVDAVLVKAGTQTYVYSYSPEVTGDTGMGSPGKWGISHVSFCYDAGENPPPPNPCGTSDMDGDGTGDLCDNCGNVANPGQEDSDHDGMGDACEPTPTCEEAHAGEADTDGDGKVDACDNCPAAANPGQEDSDNDGMGNVCEPTPTCAEAHAGEADTDGDGTVDACDDHTAGPSCEKLHAGEADSDGDGKVDACDNCPSAANAGQQDSDNDGMGDACEAAAPAPTCDQLHAGEADSDADGKVDACDNCPTTMNPGQEDTDRNGVGDACTTVNPAFAEQQPAPAGQPSGQIVLGDRISRPTARLIAASGCTKRTFTAGVRGTGIAKVVFTVDGKRLRTVTKRNAKGLYALRINPAKYRIGVHRIVVKVTFQANRRAASRTLRATFQRCSQRLIAPRFTG